MSKKAILTDFSALKGKITLSDAKDITTPQPKPQTQPQQTKAKETHLKVGRQVVLMDSSLRGHIVSLGKRVGIELEDGLLIEASYGEFAVTDGTELQRLKSSKVKHIQTLTRTPRSKAPGCLEIDLHIEAIPGGRSVPKGQQLQFQMDTFRRVIRDNMSHKGRKISFIHGIGDGILKEAIRKELDEVFALRCTYSVGDPAVTVVTIR